MLSVPPREVSDLSSVSVPDLGSDSGVRSTRWLAWSKIFLPVDIIDSRSEADGSSLASV